MTTADRMAVLEAGVLQQVGTPRDLFDAPVNRFVAEFVGSTNLLPDARTRRARCSSQLASATFRWRSTPTAPRCRSAPTP